MPAWHVGRWGAGAASCWSTDVTNGAVNVVAAARARRPVHARWCRAAVATSSPRSGDTSVTVSNTGTDGAQAADRFRTIRFPLLTERLLLRPLVDADAVALLPIWSDPANERFIGATPPQTLDDLRAWIRKGIPWGVWERASDELVGDCGLFVNDDGELELAYGFRRDRWGRGYATEAGAAALRAAFEHAGARRVVADVDPAHVASRRVLEKLGFVEAGRLGDKLLYEARRAAA